MHIHSNHGLTRGVSRLGQSLRAAPVGEPLEINDVLVAFHFQSSEWPALAAIVTPAF